MRWLALVLFAPWFAILVWAYWAFPKSLPRTLARRAFDLAAIAVAVGISAWAMIASYEANADIGGSIWKQVAASSFIYGAFLGVLLLAVVVRALAWRRRAP
ncbi:hypothetical protein ACQQ2N_03690 [Dokdonella sp. MW10]|uniref:hypothetical protein n=1 Tax=Dokdonella sp. MW10 TaxID=2992926 RepID=UPI003F7E4FE4